MRPPGAHFHVPSVNYSYLQRNTVALVSKRTENLPCNVCKLCA